MSAERALGLGIEHGIQSWVTGSSLARAGCDVFYEWAFYPLLIVALICLGLFRREVYRDTRRALIISLGLAVIVFLLFPTAPPRLLHGLGIHDTVGMHDHDVDSFHGITYNPYAAMPSLHVGWSLIVAHGVFCAVRLPLVRLLAILHPIAMAFVTIATGNHYVLDCLAGALIAVVALRSAGASGSAPAPRGVRRPARSPMPVRALERP